MSVDVTVVICTWNRAELLDQSLAQMRNLSIPEAVTWELIVVNNKCTDHTDDVLDRHEKELPLRRLFEARSGLSNARNCAAAAARGELILWTDDDVLVDPDWLAQYVAASRAFPEAMFFGGTVNPWFAQQPPSWLLPHLDWLSAPFAIRRLGDDTREIESYDDFPFGANMAFRKSVFDDHAFDPNLGMCGENQFLGEESQLMKGLMAQGRRGVWVGVARVRHYIPAERLTRRYLWEYFRGSGRTRVRLGANERAKMKMLFGAPRHQIREYCQARLRSWLLSPFHGRAWMKAFIRAATSWGVIEESRALQRGKQQGV